MAGVDSDSLRCSLVLHCVQPGCVGYKNRKYVLCKNARVLVDIIGLHKDPRYWKRPLVFDPWRFLPERDGTKPEAMEPGSYIPFGGGPRTCIGNIFGLLEVKLALVTIYRSMYFESMGEPVTKMKVDVNPRSGSRLRLRMRASLASKAAQKPTIGTHLLAEPVVVDPVDSAAELEGSVLWAAFGSQQGTCESLAQDCVSEALAVGLRASAMPLDEMDFVALFSRETAPSYLLVFSSTYNGQPPNNASLFMMRLRNARKSSKTTSLTHLAFAVLGAGNSNWGATYMQTPTEIDQCLDALGGQRLFPFQPSDECDGIGSTQATLRAWIPIIWRTIGITVVQEDTDNNDVVAQVPDGSGTPDAGFRFMFCVNATDWDTDLYERPPAVGTGSSIPPPPPRPIMRRCASTTRSQVDLSSIQVDRVDRLTQPGCPQLVCHISFRDTSAVSYQPGE